MVYASKRIHGHVVSPLTSCSYRCCDATANSKSNLGGTCVVFVVPRPHLREIEGGAGAVRLRNAVAQVGRRELDSNSVIGAPGFASRTRVVAKEVDLLPYYRCYIDRRCSKFCGSTYGRVLKGREAR